MTMRSAKGVAVLSITVRPVSEELIFMVVICIKAVSVLPAACLVIGGVQISNSGGRHFLL